MTDDLDRDLMRMFAATAAPLPADDFVRPLRSRVALRRRIQSLPRLAVIVALFVMGAFATHTLVRTSLLAAERFTTLLMSPLGWTMCLLLTVIVVRRWRLLRH